MKYIVSGSCDCRYEIEVSAKSLTDLLDKLSKMDADVLIKNGKIQYEQTCLTMPNERGFSEILHYRKHYANQ